MRDAARGALVRLAWPLVAVVPAVLAMRGMFSARSVYAFRDNLYAFLPYHRWFRMTVAAGDSPWWDRYAALGQTAVGDPLRHLFFPPALALRAVPSEILGYNLLVGLPFPVAALGVYALARTRLSRQASALAAIVFSASSPMLSAASMPNLSWCAALAPWTILAVERAAASRSGARIALAAAAVAAQALAGEPVTLAATLGVAVAYVLATSESGARGAALAATAAALALGFLLAAVQLAPLAEAALASDRGGAAASYGQVWSLHPLRLLEAFVPFPFNDATTTPPQYDSWVGKLSDGREPFLISLYVGVPALALAALGLAAGARRRAALWGAVAAVALLCAFGRHTPFYPTLVTLVPPMRSFRIPEKYALVAALAVAMLAAEGWEAVTSRRVSSRAGSLFLAVTVAGLAVVAAGALFAPSLADALGAGSLAAPHTRFVIGNAASAVLGVAVGTAAIVVWLVRRHERAEILRATGVALVALDLLGAGAWLNPQVDASFTAEPAWIAAATAADARAFVGYNVAQYRLFEQVNASARTTDPDAFAPSVASPADASYHVGQSVLVSDSALAPSQWGLTTPFVPDVPDLQTREAKAFEYAFVRAEPERRALALDRLGVRAQLRTTAPPGADYARALEVPELGPMAAFVSSKPFSRAVVAAETAVEPDVAAASVSLLKDGFDPADRVVVDRETAAAGEPGAPAAASARVVEDRATLVRVEASAPAEATLVLVDAYGAGWRADVDGRPAEVVRVDGILRGVRVAPGSHSVTFSYRPFGLAAGAAVSLVVGLALVALAAVSLGRTRRARRASLAGGEAAR